MGIFIRIGHAWTWTVEREEYLKINFTRKIHEQHTHVTQHTTRRTYDETRNRNL